MKPEPHIQSHCKASYLVATEKGYTKHYYAESERIASKIGGKNFRLTIFDFRMNKLSSNENYLDHNIVAGSILSTQYHTLPSSHNRQSKIGNRQSHHPDHLGSSSWITYSDGKSIQHLHYLPFGESFVDQRISSFASRYTFSAKEKDTETGYGYFGARYYSSDLSIWLSVDPMSDKYPSMSAYVYCANNPMKLVDPDGREWEIDGFKYIPGENCPEEAKQNTKDKWNTMNNIYKTENGKKVIDDMNVEGVKYKVCSESHPAAKNASGSYVTNGDNTGGTIYLNGHNDYVGGLAHEMFHGYQDLNGQGKASIFGEIEARLFAQSVSNMYCGMPQFPGLDYSPVFNNSINALMNNYSEENMNNVINGFTTNIGGYDKLPAKLPNQKCLIQRFYPL